MSIAHNVCNSDVMVYDCSPIFLPRNFALVFNGWLSTVSDIKALHVGQ